MTHQTSLDDDALTPLYQQVMDEIKRSIDDGTYAADTKIPSETELSEMYSVSRITVRRAVEELVGEGLLTKRQGKGTFVNQPRLKRKICCDSDVMSFTQSCLANGVEPGARVVERDLVAPKKELLEFFGCSEDARLIRIRRVRTANGVPIMLETNYYAPGRLSFLVDADLNDVSVFDLIERETGVRPEASDPTSLEMVRATARTAEPLGVRAGEPLFFMNTHMRDADGTPLVVGHQYIVGSRYAFTI